MFTKKLTDSFTQDLLNAVSGVLGEAKKCAKGCECEACEKEKNEKVEESTAAYGKAIDSEKKKNISKKDTATIGKLAAMLKKEREGKEKKEPLGVKTEEVQVDEVAPPGAKYERMVKHIKKGYAKDGKLTDKEKSIAYATAWKAKNEAIDPGLEDELMSQRQGESGKKWRVERAGKTISTHNSKDAADTKAMKHPLNKVKANEEATIDDAFQQIDEISGKTLTSYSNKVSNYGPMKDARTREKHEKGLYTAYKKMKAKDVKVPARMEEVELEEGENLTGLPKSTAEKNKQYIEITHLLGHKRRVPVHPTNAYKALNRYRKDPSTKSARIVSEESEQIDELSKEALGSYISNAAKDLPKITGERQREINKNGITDKVGKLGRKTYNRQKGIDTAVTRLTKEEQDFIDALNAEVFDEAVSVSHARYMRSHGKKASGGEGSWLFTHKEYGDANGEDRFEAPRGKFSDAKKHAQKWAKEKGHHTVYVMEEVEITEARGRPRKAGAKDFTIHPKTKEKLMHNNPEHMARIEKLQKHGVLPKPKTEANQHIIQQLQRAKTSMRGGETIHFTHGDSTHVAGHHAAKLLDKYAGMKPDEKEAFQKKIGHSHAKLQSEL